VVKLLTARDRSSELMAVLGPVLDIVERRVHGDAPPPWCERRGWSDFLLSLEDAELAKFEASGLAAGLEHASGVPADLRELARAVQQVTALPKVFSQRVCVEQRLLRGVPARKRDQLAMLLGALGPMAAEARRIVDVGAGRGAFTRLSMQVLRREALGIERVAERVASAGAQLAVAHAETGDGGAPQFLVSDVCRDGLRLASHDLAVGLHACGELGDELIRAASAASCDAALISCCLQKISTPARVALSRGGASFSRGVLGLTNQTARLMGVETSLERTLAAREVRHALFLLLSARGVVLEPGAEMHAINRRLAHAGLQVVAARALAQRGLPGATAAELRHHASAARVAFAKLRRLSLPRNMLARLVEVGIAFDRAAHLEEHGFHSRVALLFDAAVSPRNLAIFASRHARRLPEVL
jgi:hypothetical protein